jgi:hypothetical protein
MDQSNRGSYRKEETALEAFYHSCLGKLVVFGGLLVVLFIVAVVTKPTEDEMIVEMTDNILQCLEANDSIRGDGLDDQVNNLGNVFSKADTAKINNELIESFLKNNRMEVFNHSWFRTAYIYNNIHSEGVRIGYGFFGLVYPTVTYSDLLLNVGPMQKKYNDGVIRSTIVNTHDLGSNPNVKPYHYQGDPDQ